MNEKDLFRKFPNWLRWICFIPFAIIGYFLFSIVGRFSVDFAGYEPDSALAKTALQFISIAGFIYTIYLCVPKYKEIISGIFSLLFSIIAVIGILMMLINDAWKNWDCFILLLIFIGGIVFAINMFIEHGRLTSKSESNLME